jgi:hypothetical protein
MPICPFLAKSGVVTTSKRIYQVSYVGQYPGPGRYVAANQKFRMTGSQLRLHDGISYDLNPLSLLPL